MDMLLCRTSRVLVTALALAGVGHDALAKKVGPEFRVNTYVDNDQRLPSVAALADGGFVVTWQSYDQDGSRGGIYGQLYQADGTPRGTEFQVNTWTAYEQESPSVAALADGGFVVIWQSFAQDSIGDWGIYGQRYRLDGTRRGKEFRVNTTTVSTQWHPTVAGLVDGGFVVTWESYDQDGSATGIYGQLYRPNGMPRGGEFQVNTWTDNYQMDPFVAGLTDGGFVVTWESDGQDGSGLGIYGQRYRANGVPRGNEFQVNTWTASNQWDNSVAGLADGGFVVAWQSYEQDGSASGIYGQRYRANGAPNGNEFQVNTWTTSYQGSPSVARLDDGGFVVNWRSWVQDGSRYGVYGQRYRANGTPGGREFRVNTWTAGDQSDPSVAGLIGGGFVATWGSVGQDGSGSGIYGQRFGAP